MQRRTAIIGAAAGVALVGGLLLAPSAQADPSVCVNYNVSVNGEGQAGGICLPPQESGETR